MPQFGNGRIDTRKVLAASLRQEREDLLADVAQRCRKPKPEVEVIPEPKYSMNFAELVRLAQAGNRRALSLLASDPGTLHEALLLIPSETVKELRWGSM